jgi:hypothetical protein
VITIENDVLNDPTLIDPGTGLPYGGRMTRPLSQYSKWRSLAPGERAGETMSLSRECISGLVSKSSLIEAGLSPAQAKQFFRNPMTFTFGAAGGMQGVGFARYTYGIRLYGDRK